MVDLPEPLQTDKPLNGVEMMAYRNHKLKLAKLQSKGLLNTYYEGTGSRAKKTDVRKIMKGGNMYTPEEFVDHCDKYFREIEARETVTMVASGETLSRTGKNPYTLEGLCVWLGISTQRFQEYENSDKYKDFNEIARLAMTVIVDKVASGALQGDFNSSFAQFYLVNHTKMSKDGESANEHKRKIRPTKVIYVTYNSREDVAKARQEIDITPQVKELNGHPE